MGCSSCGGNGRVGIPSSEKVVSATGKFVVKYPNGVVRSFASESAANAAVDMYDAVIISSAVADDDVEPAADEAPVGIAAADVDDFDEDTDSDDVLESNADEGA